MFADLLDLWSIGHVAIAVPLGLRFRGRHLHPLWVAFLGFAYEWWEAAVMGGAANLPWGDPWWGNSIVDVVCEYVGWGATVILVVWAKPRIPDQYEEALSGGPIDDFFRNTTGTMDPATAELLSSNWEFKPNDLDEGKARRVKEAPK